MRYLLLALSALMALFAVVQYNDPDGLWWGVIYLIPAVFAAIALMSPVLGALAGAAELVCLDGGGASAPVAGATADLAGDAHSHRSGGQMDGVLPQLLTHQLESCGALSELSAAQVVGSPPSTRAVGRPCRTEVA